MVRLDTSCGQKWGYDSLHCKQEDGQCNFYLETKVTDTEAIDSAKIKTRIHTKIEFVELPFSINQLGALSKLELKNVFSNTSFRVIRFTDGTYKLSVSLRLSGGVKNIPDAIKENPDMTDRELSSLVLANNIPKDTFSSIKVSACVYEYGPRKELAMSRCIRLIPGDGHWEVFKINLRKFFSGCNTCIYGINLNAMANYVLGIEETPEGEAGIKQSFQKKMAIYIYFSVDGLNFDVELEEQRGRGKFSDRRELEFKKSVSKLQDVRSQKYREMQAQLKELEINQAKMKQAMKLLGPPSKKRSFCAVM